MISFRVGVLLLAVRASVTIWVSASVRPAGMFYL